MRSPQEQSLNLKPGFHIKRMPTKPQPVRDDQQRGASKAGPEPWQCSGTVGFRVWRLYSFGAHTRTIRARHIGQTSDEVGYIV